MTANGNPWAVISKRGEVIEQSKSLSQYIGLKIDKIESLFQINPEWNLFKWNKFFKNDKPSKVKTSIIKHGEIIDVSATLIKFGLENRDVLLYVINDNLLDKPVVPPVEVVEKQPEIVSAEFNYDDISLNAVFYFERSGKVKFVNARSEKLLNMEEQKLRMENLFLDTELGTIVETIANYPESNVELFVKTVLRSKLGLIPGYSILSEMTSISAPGKYRLEFLVERDMHIVDKLLEEALIERNTDKKLSQLSIASNNKITLGKFDFSDIITQSAEYKKIIGQITQVADTNTTVLITGETGTGKELLANAIFKFSDRSENIMIKVNCASIPSELVESILFGHEKGSFTGADKQQIGKFEMADGGTIFLDEIGELPMSVQPKLLRILQEGELERIGSPKTMAIDVRVIAATNRDLLQMIDKGKFRRDLYYRLNVFPIHSIPLRERREDIKPLADYFLQKANIKTGRNVLEIRKVDLARLQKYNFPGNVRELENLIERSVILSTDKQANFDFLLQAITQSNESEFAQQTIEQVVINHIKKALEMTNGKITGKDSASEILGLNGKTLASKLRKYNIDINKYK